MTSLTVWVVWVCLTVSLAASASYLHSLTTLARHTPHCQRHRRKTFVHRRRCHVAISSPWRWCLSVVDVLWRWIARLLRTAERLCRQRHVTESHPAPRHGLQHTTTRSHCHLYQSINQSINITKLTSLLPHVANMLVRKKVTTVTCVVIHGFTTSLLRWFSVRPSVCPIFFLTLIRRAASFFLTLMGRTAAHTQRDSPEGSMRRGQRTFRPDSKQDRQSLLQILHTKRKITIQVTLINNLHQCNTVVQN